jgi:hypothetical protein
MTTRDIYRKYATENSVAYATFLNRVHRHLAMNSNDGVQTFSYGTKNILCFSKEREKEIAKLISK